MKGRENLHTSQASLSLDRPIEAAVWEDRSYPTGRRARVLQHHWPHASGHSQPRTQTQSRTIFFPPTLNMTLYLFTGGARSPPFRVRVYEVFPKNLTGAVETPARVARGGTRTHSQCDRCTAGQCITTGPPRPLQFYQNYQNNCNVIAYSQMYKKDMR